VPFADRNNRVTRFDIGRLSKNGYWHGGPYISLGKKSGLSAKLASVANAPQSSR
jgi:hypothetical protein